VAESTATLERHVSMAYSGTRIRSVGTRGGLGSGGAMASSVRTGICMVHGRPAEYGNLCHVQPIGIWVPHVKILGIWEFGALRTWRNWGLGVFSDFEILGSRSLGP
jgi:hypothetical protein